MSNRNALIKPGSLLALNQSETNCNLKIEPDSLVIKVPPPPPSLVLAELDKLNESRHGFKGFELSRDYKQVSVN